MGCATAHDPSLREVTTAVVVVLLLLLSLLLLLLLLLLVLLLLLLERAHYATKLPKTFARNANNANNAACVDLSVHADSAEGPPARGEERAA